VLCSSALSDANSLVKDNIATLDRMETTAGSLAMLGSRVPRDAHVVKLLREKGAVLMGKTNMECVSIR
jgi:amidase